MPAPKTTRQRQITARELIDWQIELLGFWLSETGKKFGDTFMEDEAEKWGTQKEVSGKHGLLAHIVSRPLYTAAPYYVTEEVTDLIVQAAKLRNSMHYKLEMHQLPTDAGFLVFEKQIYMRDIRGMHVGIRAMTWKIERVSTDPSVGGIIDLDQHQNAAGVSVAFYTDTYVPDLLEHDTSFAQAAEYLRRDHGVDYTDAQAEIMIRGLTRFSLLAHKGLPFGEHDHVESPEYSDDIDVILRPDDVELDIELSDEFAAKYYSGEVKMTAEIAEKLRESMAFFPHDLFVAAVLVMNQKVTGISGMHADRAVMRRAQRAGITIPTSVNIISLRRLVEQGRIFPDESDLSDPRWSHRWWTRGHWRQQWYPSLGMHQWIYIDPFVKGPADKPIIEKPDVFFMER